MVAESWEMPQVRDALHFSNNQAHRLRALRWFNWAPPRGPRPCSQTLTLTNLASGRAGTWWSGGCSDSLWVSSRPAQGPWGLSGGRR